MASSPKSKLALSSTRRTSPTCARSVPRVPPYDRSMSSRRAWSIGVVLGATAAFILPYTFALYGLPLVLAIGLSVLATVIRPRPAGLAGFLIPVGAGWLIALWRATEQCIEMNRQRDAACV